MVKKKKKKGNDIKQEEKNLGILSKKIIEKAKTDKVVADGVRNPDEIREFKKRKDAYVIAVTASQRVRFKRMKMRGREGDPTGFREFKRLDNIENRGVTKGQEINNCIKIADYVIENIGTLDELKKKVDEILESAITTIIDHEDSVAAVDAKDKIAGYRNWLRLMKGDLQVEIKKNGKKFTRKLNPDRIYINAEQKGESDFSKLTLCGRALLLNRNVGHSMTNSSILLEDESEIPEGIMDAFITTIGAMHDFKNKMNSRTGSIYIVKPKMHGPDEVDFSNTLFEKVEDVLSLTVTLSK